MKEKDKALPTTIQAAPLSEKKAKKPGKIFVILSYTLALASLIAALFVPLFGGKMFIQYVLMAVTPILSVFGVAIPNSIYGEFFINIPCSLTVGIMLTLIYISVVLALIMLIPVIAGKAAKGTNLRCAFAAEYIAFIFILAYVAWEVLEGDAASWSDFSLLIPLGVIMLVMAAQSIKYKGGLGVAKFIIFLLSLVTLFTLFDIVALVPVLEAPLTTISGIIKAYSEDVTFLGEYNIALIPFIGLCNGLFAFVGFGDIPAAIFQLISLVLPMLLMVSIFLDTISLISGKKTKANGAPNPQKGWFVVAAIRYSLIILLIAAAVVLSFVLKGFGQVGIYLYLTAVLVILTFIVEIIRYCVGKSKVKAYKRMQKEAFNNEKIDIVDNALEEENTAEAVEINQESGDYQTNIFGEEPVAAQPAAEAVEEQPIETVGEQLSIMDSELAEEPVEEATAEAVPVEEVVEEVAAAPIAVMPVETAPVEEVAEEAAPAPIITPFGEVADNEEKSIDPFIDKLTDEERAQFYDVFINRNMGKFSTIPAYEINGNNADFFPAVFVHINRMRNICSDSLLAKIYKEIGKD